MKYRSLTNFFLPLFLILFFTSCGDGEEILGNCVVAPDLDRVCTEEYQPVCACNGIVYSNSCYAEREGNLMWKSTNKDVGEECSF